MSSDRHAHLGGPARERAPGRTLHQQIEGDHVYRDEPADHMERVDEHVSEAEDGELHHWADRLSDLQEAQRREVMEIQHELHETKQQLEETEEELALVLAEQQRRELTDE